jgi:DNA-binding response OmpR family regulator
MRAYESRSADARDGRGGGVWRRAIGSRGAPAFVDEQSCAGYREFCSLPALPRVDDIIAVMRHAGAAHHGLRLHPSVRWGEKSCRRTDTGAMDDQRLILVVEDDDATRAFLLENLAADGFRVASASSAGEGIRAIEVRRPSLVVLDLALEGGSGLDLLDRVRQADGLASRIDPDLPVIVLTGRVAEADRVRSFARGADDHVNKPFLYAELLGRVRAVLRRAEGRRRQGLLRVGELTVDPSTRAVRLAGRKVDLAAKEFALLHALAEDPTRVYGKNELLRDVWGFQSLGRTRTLDAHACRLRKKLRPSSRPWVVNVRGVGYKLTEAV